MVFQHGRSHGLVQDRRQLAKIAQGTETRVLASLLGPDSRRGDDVRHSLASTFEKLRCQAHGSRGSGRQAGLLRRTRSGLCLGRSLIPRGGGSMDLTDKSVLLVGCGSVGSEVALRLTSAGVGRLTVSDPDRLSEENLYRHTLSVNATSAGIEDRGPGP